MSDLLKTKFTLPIFEQLFVHLQETGRYSAKLAVIQDCIPLMNKKIASKFMKTIELVLDYPGSNSIFKMNINPLRTGLELYQVLDKVQEDHGYSEHLTDLMKERVDGQIQKVLEVYSDPDKATVLSLQQDLQGQDCLWYLDEFNLYNILDCRIMDQIIQ